ncbi:hypothetical protein DYB28_001313 [Aphanomyces astaci]|uniref:Uncharacterized protein n=1 Tax=Aphanomyces astaci TaxID=112090 RepID=A0A397B5A9_APHAT|nr:hypothetical protein DYB25_006084 [Aphanomyces astaci]RHY14576.1 hypothetical protein DYB36_004959 [Aphanomyces astaci]RHY40874.1 hypothetical protein DYB30_008551 [Aphanomyces astaci]RHY44491.1 hypothetical protein DYB34_005632 [Aphanomyces astaci]RLO00331.1 hypothetical protein DYB28_001313 [Aphanomyces astaci]
MPKFYGRGQWDPKLIFLQIVCMQCSHYLALGLLLALFHGRNITMDQFFSYKFHAFESIDGMQTSTAHVLGGLSSALFLCVIVERAKKCLDFGLTLYFIDFVFCWCSIEPELVGRARHFAWHYSREYLCSVRELQEIPMLDLFTHRRPHSPTKSSYAPLPTSNNTIAPEKQS